MSNIINDKVNELARNWEEFKSINDRRLSEIEKKGSADSLTEKHLERINNRISDIEAGANSPEAISGGNTFENNEHKSAFNGYLRKGMDDGLRDIEQKSLSASVNTDGGYLVTSAMSSEIVKNIESGSPMRGLADVEVISKDSLEVVREATEAVAGWTTSETAPVLDSQTPTVEKVTIPVHELVAQPKATQKLIDDSSVDIESWLITKLSDVFGRTENAAFINGDGINKPKGILSYPDGTSSQEIEQLISGVDGEVTADSIVALYYALKDDYAKDATFLMNRATAQQVRLLKEGSTGQYIWQPSMAAGSPDTLMGVPVALAGDMPTPTAGSLSIALGDFKRGYQIVDRTDMRILRDPYTEKPFVKFYSTKRVGGDVVDYDAIKLLSLSA